MILIKFESFFIREQKKEKNVKLKIDFNSNQLRRHGSLIIDCSYTLPMLIHSPVHFFFTLIILGGKVTDYIMREHLIRYVQCSGRAGNKRGPLKDRACMFEMHYLQMIYI